MPDLINHPPHYTDTPPGIDLECIEYTRELHFCQGNAAKYVYRAGAKGDSREDLAKARWYLVDEIYQRGGINTVSDALLNTIDRTVSPRARLFHHIVTGHPADAIALIDNFLARGGDDLDEQD